jgi:hypothetical protein
MLRPLFDGVARTSAEQSLPEAQPLRGHSLHLIEKVVVTFLPAPHLPLRLLLTTRRRARPPPPAIL